MFSKKKLILAYVIEKCSLCGMERKRSFCEGDILFAKAEQCSSCKGITVIEKIFGEQLD